MPGVKVRDGEPIEKILRIFKKQVEKAGIIGDIKKYQHYEKPSIRLKKKSIAARKRRLKQMRKMGLVD
jgi:small subunit ribosomal protein S21